ncbi:TIGR04222 domain-containing membrane protein [Streptomyces botrytidirepellens]|uniref:TIGR04222 domain-containing membrane protein n=1 Tax=Streptomyces botrytidirepellens TaxID=2486417 RepID=A0A3M8TI08_9ACTN|nr:TIGR04222 domain-containing membrane protein [Streptomyces botrytidirepellens]RNF92705.1 TIGR04222 domain-containing membrane protein [Streptomyces botrytidirepellens]
MRGISRRTTDAAPQTLDLYDVAYLSGAPQRMMEVALVALHERGAVRIRLSRVRVVDEPADQLAHPVERAVLALCRRRSRSTISLLGAVEIGPEAEEIERRMISSGLITPRRCRLTRAGRQHLEAAEQSGAYPAYVFEGLAALPDRALRYHIGEVIEPPLTLGRRLIRLGEALDDWGSDHGHGGGHSCGGHSCGGGGGGNN